MKKILSFCISVLCMTSCVPGFLMFNAKKQVKKNVSIRYTGNGIGVDRYLHTNGFYTTKDNQAMIPDNSERCCIMFFNDGTMVEFWLSRYYCYNKNADSIINNLYTYINERKIPILRRSIYKIVNDIIYANTFYIDQSVWSVSCHKYKIDNPERIRAIYNGWDWDTCQNCNDEYMFVPIKEHREKLNMLYIDYYLKKQKWLWENEEDWKKWKRNRIIKQGPRRYKHERYGSGAEGYTEGNENYFDIKVFHKGGEPFYINPRTGKSFQKEHLISGARHSVWDYNNKIFQGNQFVKTKPLKTLPYATAVGYAMDASSAAIEIATGIEKGGPISERLHVPHLLLLVKL